MRRAPKLPLLGLVMIVKNGGEQLTNALTSVLPLIGTWTVCDTGSTDGTVDRVEELLGHIPGRLWRHEWHNFGRNLTLALARARDTAQWLLRLDADMTIEAGERFLPFLKHEVAGIDALEVQIEDHGDVYRLPLLVRGGLKWRYSWPTHEYLEKDGRTFIPLGDLAVVHHYGEKTTEDFLRDLDLLAPYFRKQNPRAVFYVAQTHKALGNIDAAVQAYELRASLNGWEEERWYASYQVARLRGDVDGLYECWRARPWRHEPLTAAARLIGQAPARQIDGLFLERPI